ncbi:hypothetical protein EMPG_14349 [Blastomyces silverae]|uniref:Uncharacterized protein n=1 Tax=Blastomyces silverae TaxID=2060906 RepID=A0A0H1BFV1_9EURO|nr:hypothetical protein EMPG_14349 [Blastomyces silverae]
MPGSHATLTGWRDAPANLPQTADHVISTSSKRRTESIYDDGPRCLLNVVIDTGYGKWTNCQVEGTTQERERQEMDAMNRPGSQDTFI